MRTQMTIRDEIAYITIDDGKVNAMSTEMLEEITGRLGEAASGARVTVLSGRPGIFSAGFDMPTFSEGLEPTLAMMGAGMHTILALLSHPHPVVAACTGHAFPMGAFLMLCSDERYGVRGDFRIGMNEVAIGLTVPRFALALAEHRLSRPGFARASTGTLFSPDDAIAAGYLDHVVAAETLDAAVGSAAEKLLAINLESYVGTKKRMNDALCRTIGELAKPETLTAELMELAGA